MKDTYLQTCTMKRKSRIRGWTIFKRCVSHLTDCVNDRGLPGECVDGHGVVEDLQTHDSVAAAPNVVDCADLPRSALCYDNR